MPTGGSREGEQARQAYPTPAGPKARTPQSQRGTGKADQAKKRPAQALTVQAYLILRLLLAAMDLPCLFDCIFLGPGLCFWARGNLKSLDLTERFRSALSGASGVPVAPFHAEGNQGLLLACSMCHFLRDHCCLHGVHSYSTWYFCFMNNKGQSLISP